MKIRIELKKEINLTQTLGFLFFLVWMIISSSVKYMNDNDIYVYPMSIAFCLIPALFLSIFDIEGSFEVKNKKQDL